jgi:signal transduction histidine kinase
MNAMPPQSDATNEHIHSYNVSFAADVHLIRVLGEQLIGSERVGILELIKNAYDAGASECHVWIEKVPGLPEAEPSDAQVAELPGPVITVIDNGCGMDKYTIENGWLRAATRIKTSVKERLKSEREAADKRGTRAEYDALVAQLKREHGGRLPLGEKGVGRFATHRLGTHLILRTKTKDEPYEWLLEIDWTEFDTPDDEVLDLDEVELTLVPGEPSRGYGPTASGTMLRMYGGRRSFEWTKNTLLDIAHAIAQLRSPVEVKQPKGFDVVFHCPQLSEEIQVLTETVPAPFLCTAIVDEQGKGEIEIRFVPPRTLTRPYPARTWTASVDLRRPPVGNPTYWSSSGNGSRLRVPESGPFTVDIKVWLRVKEWIDYVDWAEFKTYLDRFGGISIYRDGLAILPAQITSRDDWLGLARRHIMKGWNISYYQMRGSVDLLQEQTLDLVDRTSREGLLETRPFVDLRELMRTIMVDLQLAIKETRDGYKRLKRGEQIPDRVLTSRSQVVSEVLKTVAARYDFQTDDLTLKEVIGESRQPERTLEILAETVDQVRREIADLRAQSGALLEAAGYGIAIAVAVHEIEKVTSNLYFGLDQLSKKTTLLKDPEVHTQSRELARTAQSLLNELKRLAPLRVTRFERLDTFEVRDSILAASGAFRLSWRELGIGFTLPLKEDDFEVFGSFGACSQVFANLFDNATYWLRQVELSKRRIVVRVEADERRAVVADNGPGIAEMIRPHLFEPYYSLKSPPSGLGLYICRYYMQQMKGTIRESYKSEQVPGYSGAHFTLVFPKETQEE